jgi:hypothetical protein
MRAFLLTAIALCTCAGLAVAEDTDTNLLVVGSGGGGVALVGEGGVGGADAPTTESGGGGGGYAQTDVTYGDLAAPSAEVTGVGVYKYWLYPPAMPIGDERRAALKEHSALRRHAR